MCLSLSRNNEINGNHQTLELEVWCKVQARYCIYLNFNCVILKWLLLKSMLMSIVMVQSDSIANHTMWCYAYCGNHNLNNAHKMMNVTSVANSNNWLKIQLICSLESHYYYQCPVTTSSMLFKQPNKISYIVCCCINL